MVSGNVQSRCFRLLVLVMLVLPSWLPQSTLAHADNVNRSPSHDAADAADDLLQFQSGEHVLGFAPDGMLVSNGTYALRVGFVDANAVTPQAAEKGTSVGGAAPRLMQVTYPDLWDGITLAYDAGGGIARSTYTVEAGADPAAIRLHYNVPVVVEADGSLRIDYETGTLHESAPVAWQEINGAHVPVEVAFALLPGDEVSFRVGQYDTCFPLIIDPTLAWNTFLGGSGADGGNAMVVDGSGNVYVTGYSRATWGSPVRAYNINQYDAFVAKLGSDGSLTWNTFLGGDGSDRGYGIAVDSSGNVYVSGNSGAAWGDSPVRAHSGGYDAFVAKLDNNGNLTWHTFLGSSGSDQNSAIAVDSTGNVYAMGYSDATWGSPVQAHSGGTDAFAAKLTNDGALTWNTFLGGSGYDYSSALTVDGSGNVYVVGYSNITWGSPVRAYGGGNRDAFAARLASGGSLTWHTFLGGNDDDNGYAVAVDDSGNVYVAGASDATWGSPVRAHPGDARADAFVARLTNGGSLTWNTFLGTSDIDYGYALTTIESGNIYVTGYSSATWGDPEQEFNGGRDAFVASLDNNGGLTWNTFLGGSGDDYGQAIAVDAGENVYVTGYSNATWGNPVQSFGGGTNDAYVVKLEAGASTPELALTKSVVPILAVPGDLITYTIAFNNTSKVTATSVAITDTLSSAITGASYTSSGVALTHVGGSQYAWTAPDLAQNEGGMITVTGTLAKPLAAGVFTNTVTLAVSGTTATADAPLTVQNIAPVADAGADQTVGVDELATLNGSGTDDNGDTLSYGWAQTGGTPLVTLSDATSQAPTFTAPTGPTVLTFTLTVTDSHGTTDTDEVVVTVEETQPKPVVTKMVSPASAKPGEAITYTIAFSNTGGVIATHVMITDTLSAAITGVSYTSSGVALTQVGGSPYAWTAPDLAKNDGGIITITGTLAKPLAAGVFTNTVTLAVSGTTVTADAPLTVLNTPPVADAGGDQTVHVGTMVTLDGSGSGDADGDLPLTYTWIQTGGTAVTLSGAQTAAPSFTAPGTAGVLTFTLRVTDSQGLASMVANEVVIRVRNTAPVADAGGDQTVHVGTMVVLDGSGSSDADGDLPLTYGWTQTGGTAVAFTPGVSVTTFTAPGTAGVLTFTLRVTDSLGLASTAADDVVIRVTNTAPVADAGGDRTVHVGTVVTLDGSGSSDADGDLPLTYAWTQTGGTAVAFTPGVSVTTFTAPGTAGVLTFTLRVTDSQGLATTVADEVVIRVTNTPPVADAGSDQTVHVGVAVTLDGSGSSDVDGDLPLAYTWTQTGGTAVAFTPSVSVTTFTAPGTAGVLTFTLHVTDSLGLASTAADEVVITIGNTPPVADAGGDQAVHVGAAVTLDGSGSSDADGDLPLTYAWTQTGGTVVVFTPGVSVTTFTAPGTAGVLTFTLRVTDSQGLASTAADEVVITVGNTPPVADAGDDQTVHVGVAVTLDGSGSSDADGDLPLAYTWTQTGGTVVVFTPGVSVTTFTAPGTAGVLTFTLTVTDSQRLAATVADEVVITVGNTPPVADGGGDQTVHVGTMVTLDGSGSSDVDGDLPLTYGWTQTGGPAVALSSAQTVAPGFTAPGSPTVLTFTLWVTDSYGLVSLTADDVVITVNDVPVSGLIVASDSPTIVGQTTFFTATAEGSNLTYTWNFGDGSPLASGPSPTISHTYPAIATYTAVVTITNAWNSQQVSIQVQIRDAVVYLYLPLVQATYTVAPDLVVERLTVTANNVEVVIKNQGNAPVEDNFWVDVYLNPTAAPTQVNQTWNAVGDHGLVWGVGEGVLPLAAGESLTLTVGDAAYVADYSSVSWPLAAGTQVYAQVDSAGDLAYGAIRESDELSRGVYNNVTGPVASTMAAGQPPVSSPQQEPFRLPEEGDFPERP